MSNVSLGKQLGVPYNPFEVRHLEPLNYLASSVWIYDPFRWRQCFANRAALVLWNAKSLEEFQQKDFLDNSAATDKFLFGLVEKFGKTVKIIPSTPGTIDPSSYQSSKTLWTIYPLGKPIVLTLSYSPHLFPLELCGNQLPLNYHEFEWQTKYKLLLMIEASPQDPIIADTLRSLEMIRHVTAMVSLYDLKGSVILQNCAAQTELHIERDNREPAQKDDTPLTDQKIEIDWKTWLPYISAREHVQYILECLNNKKEVQLQVEVKLPDKTRYHLLNVKTIRDPVTGKQLILVHEDDITNTVDQQKENIETLLANKIKDEFLANTSHELKTPLHGIIGLAEAQLHEEQAHEALVKNLDEEGNKANLPNQEESVEVISSDLPASKKRKTDTSQPSSARKQENLALIIQCARRLGVLVDDLLDLSKLSHTFRLQKVEVDVSKTVNEVISLSQPLLKQYKKFNLELKNKIPHNLPKVYVDENRLKQVLHNLISNAIKFTHEGYVEIRANIQDKFLVLHITDTGVGIHPHHLKTIFKPFIQHAREISHGGVGLGLAVAQKLVQLHGGEISVQSQIGKGSTFSFSVPLASSVVLPPQTKTAETTSKQEKPTNLTNNNTPIISTNAQTTPTTTMTPTTSPNTTLETGIVSTDSKTVSTSITLLQPTQSPSELSFTSTSTSGFQNGSKELINHIISANHEPSHEGRTHHYLVLSVDDDPINQIIIKNILQKEGYTVEQAMDGFQALDFLKKSAKLPDLILLDVMMPGMSGPQVCRSIREHDQWLRIPVIMISAATQKQNVEDGIQSGANDYIGKPFRKAELLKKIETQLREA